MIRQIKVRRYWPGKAPKWAEGADKEDDIGVARAVAWEKAFPRQEDFDFVRKDDRRLRRLAESRIDNRDGIRSYHRRISQAEIVSTEEENRRNEGMEVEEEDEDALQERRRRIRKKLLQMEQEETALLQEEEEEEEEESEYEADSE